MKAVIIGFMASGKTTVANTLSQNLNIEHYDLDTMIENRAGMSISEFFRRFGEKEFRCLEQLTLKDALKKKGILATGGGTPIKPVNSDVIKQQNTPVILLNASDETVRKRLINGGIESRPLCKKLGLNGVIDLKNERQSKYEEVADVIVNVDGRTPELVAKEILMSIQKVKKG